MVYIQGLYKVYNGSGVRSTFAVLELAMKQGHRQPPEFTGMGLQKRIFKVVGETIGGQSIEKSFQMKKVCLPVQRTYTRVVHVCKHPYQTVNHAVHHALKKVCAALDNPNCKNKYSNKPNGMIISVFGMSAAATGIWWLPLARSIFKKTLKPC
jgi:hypothetical protein